MHQCTRYIPTLHSTTQLPLLFGQKNSTSHKMHSFLRHSVYCRIILRIFTIYIMHKWRHPCSRGSSCCPIAATHKNAAPAQTMFVILLILSVYYIYINCSRNHLQCRQLISINHDIVTAVYLLPIKHLSGHNAPA